MKATFHGPARMRAALKAILASPPEGREVFPADDRKRWLMLRERDVTASVAAALFGDIHPYSSAYTLWASKSGKLASSGPENAVMRRGRLLEPIALQILAEDNPTWGIVSPNLYYRLPASRIGGTPDSLVIMPERPGFGIVQVKTVARQKFVAEWCDEEGEPTPPLWVCVQATIEAVLTGASYAFVLPLRLADEGLEAEPIEIPIKPALVDRLAVLTADFWRRVAENDPYDPDFGKDAAAIAAVQGEGNGIEADLSGDARIAALLEQRDACLQIESQGRAATKAREPIDAELRHLMGNASSALAHGDRVLEIVTRRRSPQFTQASESTSLQVRPLRRRVREPEAEFTGSF